MKKGFTLIEVVVAITIFSVIMVSVFEIYSRVLHANKRLEMSRELQENARLIIETIADDVRQNGIDFSCYINTPLLCGTNDNREDGTSILATKTAKYYLMKNTPALDAILCTHQDVGCYLWKELPDGSKVRLSTPLVELKNVRFFLSGVDSKLFSHPTDSEGKVTITFELSIAPGHGQDIEDIKTLIIPVQTTISEKLYKARSS